MGRPIIDRTGEISYTKNGTPAKIVEYIHKNKVLVEFQDEYKYRYYTKYDYFKKGTMTNPYECRNTGGIGFIGVGEYNSIKDCEPYAKWRHIIRRGTESIKKGYSELSYIGCTVCEEWLNFQNFAKWYYDNIYECNETICVDKDILGHGQKHYSPQTCLLVPERINLLFIKEKGHRKDLPIGVSYSKSRNKYESFFSVYGCNTFLGSYDTPEDAFAAYKKAKERFIKQMADDYKDIIPKKVYDALYNYEVFITD